MDQCTQDATSDKSFFACDPSECLQIQEPQAATDSWHFASEATICPQLQKGWCHEWNHIRGESEFSHPSSMIRCRYVDKVGPGEVFPSKNLIQVGGKFIGCTAHNCKYQHPHPGNKDHLILAQSIAKSLNLTPEMLAKKNCFYLVSGLETSKCPLFPACSDVHCRKQHVLAEQPHKLATTTHEDFRTEMERECCEEEPMSLKPGTSGDFDYIVRLCKKSCESVPIVIEKVDVVRGTLLLNKYRAASARIGPFNEVTAFHGTEDQKLQSIIQKGFGDANRIANKSGQGIPFTRDPQAAICSCKGSKQLIVCQLLIGGTPGVDYTWVKEEKFYLVNNADCCLPVWVLTYK